MRCISSTSSLRGCDLGPIAQEGQFQLEAGEDGAEIMADARQHGGALLHLPGDAVAHVEEGEARRLHLAGAARAEVAGIAPGAEALRGAGEIGDGPDLVPQEDDGDGQQQQRRDQHEEQQEAGAGGERALIARLEAEDDAIRHLDAHIDDARPAAAVDPEGLAGLDRSVRG